LFFKYFIKPLIILAKITETLIQNKKLQENYIINCKEVNTIYNGLKQIGYHIEHEKELSNKLKFFNKKLEQKVADRTEELQNALAIKTEILNNMNHEIRTPVHGFSVLSEGLIEHWQEFDDKKKYDITKHIASNAFRLKGLINNLLDLSSLSNGKLSLHPEKIDLNLLIEDMITECNTMYMQGKNINITYVPKHPLIITADREKINQILRNLLINAINYTPSGKKIEIKAKIENKNLYFSLKDQGIGIAKDELEGIFIPFTQGKHTKTSAGGTGLGLAICHNIISAHGGKIWAKNNKDRGATFYFTIPVVNKDIRREGIILLIDDEDICITSMELILHNSGYQLLTAKTGKEGMDIIENKEVDLILLDLMLPDINGLDLLEDIRRKGVNIPVVIQSGAGNVTPPQYLDVKEFLSKPYHKDAVLALIDKVIIKEAIS
jgi:two-component system, sensor histidine kinase ChiS